MFYDRKIKYLELMEDGVRIQGAGFVKLEVRGETVSLQIKVERLRPTDSMTVQVLIAGEGKEALLGELVLDNGRGSLSCEELSCGDMAGGISYNELEEVCLKIHADRMLRCVIREKTLQAAQMPDPAETSERESGAMLEETSEKELAVIPAETFDVETLYDVPTRNSMQQPRQQPELGVEQAILQSPGLRQEEDAFQQLAESLALQMPRAERTNGDPAPVREMPHRLPVASTKWQQLATIYPRINPFADHREYLQLKPEDLVILSREYYPLSSNSFLLHGYYNYNHLILVKETLQGSERYYIGVPGNFYAKEKQVAVLFGFESFEGKAEPAGSGDFGYYMISVEI